MFWRGFLLTTLRKRGPGRVQLVISDQHAASWPPWTAPSRAWRTNAAASLHPQPASPAHVPKNQVEMVAALFRTIFAQPDPRGEGGDLGGGARPARRPVPQDRAVMDQAKAEVLAFNTFPGRALAQDLVHQPPRAPQQGDQTPRPCRGHLFPTTRP